MQGIAACSRTRWAYPCCHTWPACLLTLLLSFPLLPAPRLNLQPRRVAPVRQRPAARRGGGPSDRLRSNPGHRQRLPGNYGGAGRQRGGRAAQVGGRACQPQGSMGPVLALYGMLPLPRLPAGNDTTVVAPPLLCLSSSPAFAWVQCGAAGARAGRSDPGWLSLGRRPRRQAGPCAVSDANCGLAGSLPACRCRRICQRVLCCPLLCSPPACLCPIPACLGVLYMSLPSLPAHLACPPPPGVYCCRYMWLQDFAEQAQERGALVFLALSGQPAVHGPVQRMLEELGVPCTGSGHLAAETCADKPALVEQVRAGSALPVMACLIRLASALLLLRCVQCSLPTAGGSPTAAAAAAFQLCCCNQLLSLTATLALPPSLLSPCSCWIWRPLACPPLLSRRSACRSCQRRWVDLGGLPTPQCWLTQAPRRLSACPPALASQLRQACY